MRWAFSMIAAQYSDLPGSISAVIVHLAFLSLGENIPCAFNTEVVSFAVREIDPNSVLVCRAVCAAPIALIDREFHHFTSLSYGNHLAKHHAQSLLIPLILILFYSPFAVFYYHRYYSIVLTLIKFIIPALLRHGVRSVWIKPMATTRD